VFNLKRQLNPKTFNILIRSGFIYENNNKYYPDINKIKTEIIDFTGHPDFISYVRGAGKTTKKEVFIWYKKYSFVYKLSSWFRRLAKG
jgi:hypothetical protein